MFVYVFSLLRFSPHFLSLLGFIQLYSYELDLIFIMLRYIISWDTRKWDGSTLLDWFEDSKKSQISFIHLDWYDEHIFRSVHYPQFNSFACFVFVVAVKCVRKWVCYKMVLHPSTCIIYKMQYHIWIAMCTIFVHLPKCCNAIFRFWFRLGIFTFISLLVFFSLSPLYYLFHSFHPFPSCNYRIAAIHLFRFILCV